MGAVLPAIPLPVLPKLGDTLKFRRWVPYGISTAPLVEGLIPTAANVGYEEIVVQIGQRMALTRELLRYGVIKGNV